MFLCYTFAHYSQDSMDLKEKVFSQTEELFMRYGIKSITMDDIAKELGISKKTLYQLVENKADLINKIIEDHIKREKEAIDNITASSKDAIEEMINIAQYVSMMLRTVSPTVIYDLKKYYRNAFELMESLHRQYIYSVIKTNIESGINQKLYRKEIDADIIAKLYISMSSQLVDSQIFSLKEYNREALYGEMIKYHFNGIASSKGLELLKKHASVSSR